MPRCDHWLPAVIPFGIIEHTWSFALLGRAILAHLPCTHFPDDPICPDRQRSNFQARLVLVEKFVLTFPRQFPTIPPLFHLSRRRP